MIRLGRRGRVKVSHIFPAGRPGYRTTFPRLRSGLTIRAVEMGDPAAPPVLLVPGWGCSVYAFRFTLPALAAAGFRAIAVDLKGHGLSDKPYAPAEYTIDSLVDHLRDIIEVLELDRPAMIGHSMGASLLYHFAARFPGGAAALGLLSPVGLSGVPPMWIYHILTPRFMVLALRAIKPRLAVKIALSRVYGERGTFTEEDIDQYWAPICLAESPRALRELLHSYDWNASRRRRLEPVSIPAIGLWGSLDHLMPRGGMEIYKRLVPGIELHEIVGAGHVIPEETPEEVNAALVSFLRRHPAPGYIANA